MSYYPDSMSAVLSKYVSGIMISFDREDTKH